MARREIHELSYDELVLYEKQLQEELTKVRFRLNQQKKAKFHPDLAEQTVKEAWGRKPPL